MKHCKWPIGKDGSKCWYVLHDGLDVMRGISNKWDVFLLSGFILPNFFMVIGSLLCSFLQGCILFLQVHCCYGSVSISNEIWVMVIYGHFIYKFWVWIWDLQAGTQYTDFLPWYGSGMKKFLPFYRKHRVNASLDQLLDEFLLSKPTWSQISNSVKGNQSWI